MFLINQILLIDPTNKIAGNLCDFSAYEGWISGSGYTGGGVLRTYLRNTLRITEIIEKQFKRLTVVQYFNSVEPSSGIS